MSDRSKQKVGDMNRLFKATAQIRFTFISVFLIGPLIVCSPLSAQPDAPHVSSDTKTLPTQQNNTLRPAQPIRGALVIHGGGQLPDTVAKHFFDLAGKSKAKLVVIPTASSSAEDGHDTIKASWKQRGIDSVTVLHTTDRKTANSEKFIKPITQATAVWISGGLQSRLEKAYVGTAAQRALHKLLDRGGVIGGSSAGAAIMTQVMIRQGNPVPVIGRGLGLLPNGIVDQHFLARKRQARLTTAIDKHAGLVGYGIDESTAMVVRGRSIYVIGKSTVSVFLGKSENRPKRVITLGSRSRADLVALSRAAIERTKPAYPPVKPPVPVVAKGTLIIVGGGATMPMLQRFIKEAGGAGQPIVLVPTANGASGEMAATGLMRLFKRAGATNLLVVHATTVKEAVRPANLEKLAKAKGVWFGGGRQWRLVDSYLDTKVEQAFHDVLKRGGVIGGSSAGATIQGDYLVRGNPLGNREMMSEGYERGFAFLPGVAIDQHFTQRNRFKDMDLFKKTFPQMIGLGIDENTAVVVQGHTMQVMGKYKVAIYAHPKSADEKTSSTKYIRLKAGERYDLKARREVETSDTNPD